MATSYASLGDYASALRLARESHESGKQFADFGEMMRTSIGQGDILLRLGQTDEARTMYQRALEYASKANYAPFEVQAWTGLAEAELRARRWASAEEALNRAESVAGASVLAKARMERLRGECAMGRGDFDEARKRFEAAVELGDRVAARRGLAAVLMRRGDLKGAWEQLDLAIQELERVRSRAPGPELRMSFLRENARAPRPCWAPMPVRAR